MEEQVIVITGALGMIGSCLVRHLNDQGCYRLLLVDDFDVHRFKNLYNKKYLELIAIDELFRWLEGKEDSIKAIFHIGAISSTTTQDGMQLYDRNYRYSIRLAEVSLKYKIRMIYASSTATYGACSGYQQIDDITGLKPLNGYGMSKHMFDLWVETQDAFDTMVGLKYFNVYGPNEYHKGSQASMVFHMFNQIKEKGYVSLFKSNSKEITDGEQSRDFIYVKDVVKMSANFLFDNVGGLFNIGTGESVTFNRLAEMVFVAMERKIDIRYIPIPEGLSKQYQNYTRANMNSYNEYSLKERKESFCCINSMDGVADYVRLLENGSEIW